MQAVGGLARSKALRWRARGMVIALAVSVVGLAPVTGAAAEGVATENFALAGSWSCTFNCSLNGVWGITGDATSLCQETEAEIEDSGIDVPPTLTCAGATFSGIVNGFCVLGVCTEAGSVDFHLQDTSDPDGSGNPYAIPPITVGIDGIAVLASASAQGVGEQAYVLNAAFDAANNYPWSGALAWGVAGELQGAGCSGTASCTFSDHSFAVTLSGVEVDT